MEETFDDFCNTQFAKTLKLEIERRIGNIKISDKTVGGLKKGSDTVKNFGEYLSKFAQGKKGAQGFESIFKLGTYSGSNAHKFVLDAGKFFGHKFKPWEAVKAAQKIGQVGKILGVAGALVGVAAQIWNDQQEKKVENQLLEVRSDIRNTFNSAANVINMKFDEATQTWVEENYDTVINELDGKIKELTLLADIKEEEYQAYISLLNRTRALIREVHIAAE